jgi:hypothetical protein
MQFLVTRLLGVLVLVAVALGISHLSPILPTLEKAVTYDSPATTSSKHTLPKAKSVATTASPKATSTLPKIASTTPLKKNKSTQGTSTPAKVPASPSEPPIQSSAIIDLNTKVRQSIVNILCRTNVDGSLKAISGSGVIIDPRGVIITNAHVAQYFLIKNYAGPNSVDCAIRTGSPAKLAYTAELLFISPKWVTDNKNDIIEDEPLGTGENDYAFLLITGTTDGSTLPSSFPATDFSISDSDIDRFTTIPHVVAGYPAGFLGGAEIERDLNVASAVSTIIDVFTFDKSTIDLISVGGSVVAQRGASGGGVVSGKTGKLVGLIVTTTDAPTTGERDLRAITIAHVERAMEAQSGKSIRGYLSGDLKDTLAEFNGTTYPYLSNILKDVLTKK